MLRSFDTKIGRPEIKSVKCLSQNTDKGMKERRRSHSVAFQCICQKRHSFDGDSISSNIESVKGLCTSHRMRWGCTRVLSSLLDWLSMHQPTILLLQRPHYSAKDLEFAVSAQREANSDRGIRACHRSHLIDFECVGQSSRSFGMYTVRL